MVQFKSLLNGNGFFLYFYCSRPVVDEFFIIKIDFDFLSNICHAFGYYATCFVNQTDFIASNLHGNTTMYQPLEKLLILQNLTKSHIMKRGKIIKIIF